MLSNSDLKEFLDEKYDLYNRLNFIDSDPIQIPHSFSKKEDIEISAFLTAIIAWGKRKMIIDNAQKLMSLLDRAPFDFVMNASETEFERLSNFKHRTFNSVDLIFFLRSLRNIYLNHGGLETVFSNKIKDTSVREGLIEFRERFFEIEYPDRTQKHIANVLKKSAAKRINMFLMWMCRDDDRPVHFGLWKTVDPAKLMMPIDVHSGNVARKLNLLQRKQNDWAAVEELTGNLRAFDPKDPVKYDFALFGLGIFEKFA